MDTEVLAWQGFAILLVWVPFAVTAFVVEHWNDPVARRWRQRFTSALRPRPREHRQLAWGR